MIAPILSHVFYSFSSCVQCVLLADSCSYRKGGLFPHGLYNSVLSSIFGSALFLRNLCGLDWGYIPLKQFLFSKYFCHIIRLRPLFMTILNLEILPDPTGIVNWNNLSTWTKPYKGKLKAMSSQSHPFHQPPRNHAKEDTSACSRAEFFLVYLLLEWMFNPLKVHNLLWCL